MRQNRELLDALSVLFAPGTASVSDAVKKEALQQAVYPLITTDEKALQLIGKNVKICYEQEQLIDALEGIPFIILKGLAAAIYYPESMRRMQGDIDVIAAPSDIDAVCEALIAAGFKTKDPLHGNARHIHFKRNGVTVELHRRFAQLNTVEQEDLLDGWIFEALKEPVMATVDQYTFPMLPDELNGLVLLTHISQHLEEGLGLRQILDWVMYVNRMLPDDSWESFREKTDQLGLTTLAIAAARIGQLYLKAYPNLMWCSDGDDQLAEDLLDYIWSCGNFGTKLGKDAAVAMVMSHGKGNPLKHLQIRGEQNWDLLDDHPGLRPLAWMYQAARYANRGIKKGIRLSDLKKDLRESKRRNAIVEKLGARQEGIRERTRLKQKNNERGEISVSDYFFLTILSDFLNGRETAAPDEQVDWESLISLARIHEVRGIVYYQCRDFIPDTYRSRFEQLYGMEVFSYHNRLELFNSMSAALHDASIPFFTVKGLEVAALYPEPALRTMGDCDIVVKSKDKERAHEVFMALGYENQNKEGHEWTYFKNNLEFELHDHLLYDEYGNTTASRAFCEGAWDHVNGNSLDWSFHYIFLLLHLHKHLIHSGVGFRQFMDLYVVEHGADLDWGWINTELSEMGLLAFSERCRELTESWFGSREMTDVDKVCLEKVFNNGIFGFHDAANKENRKADRLIHRDGPMLLARVRQITGSAFPPYRNMRYVKHYSGLNGHPWLLPAFWVYRWFRAVKYNKLAEGRRMVDDALVSNREIEERREDLKKWGL